MKLVQHNEYIITIMDTDGLVLKHQGISSHITEYAPMRFQLFWGEHIEAKWHLYVAVN